MNRKNQKSYLRISDLIKLSGIPRTTIHYYLREGILHPPLKTGKTMGYYDETHLQRLQSINRMKIDERLSMPAIKERLKALDRSGRRHHLPVDIRGEKGGRRRAIVDAAIRVFSEQGYHRTKVQDITKEAGISTGTFYTYFQNKKDLFVEVVDSVFRVIVGEAAIAIRNETDPFRRLEIRGQVFFKNYMKYNEILHQLRAEMAGEDSWPAERVKKAYKELTEPVVSEVKDMIAKGLCRPVNPELLAYALTGVTEILSMRVIIDKDYTFPELQVFMRDLFLNGIGIA